MSCETRSDAGYWQAIAGGGEGEETPIDAARREALRRELERPFARSPERAEQVIRERFGVYIGVPAAKFETMRPVNQVVEEIAGAVSAAATF